MTQGCHLLVRVDEDSQFMKTPQDFATATEALKKYIDGQLFCVKTVCLFHLSLETLNRTLSG